MKGAVFTGFAAFVEDTYGFTCWLQCVDACKLPSNGEYLTSQIYEDSELVELSAALSDITNQPLSVLHRQFGEHFFSTLFTLTKKHVEHISTLFDFLKAVDSIIHIEVQKADPLAYTPSLFYDAPQTDTLLMRYVSKRKLCYFAEGLVLGAANHFDESVSISQDQCMHVGDKDCLIRIKKIK